MNRWKRQHMAAIFISFLKNMKEMIFTIIAVFVFGQSGQDFEVKYYLIFITGLLLFSLINGIIKWWTFKYQLIERELQIKRGLIFRKNRYIRKERIQSIDINAKLLQRIFGLVELRIETAGGGAEPEFRIVALKNEEAQAIKGELLIKTEEDESPPFDPIIEKEQPLTLETDEKTGIANDRVKQEENPSVEWKLTTKRLVIAAITSSGIGIAATFVAVISSQLQQLIPDTFYDQFIGWILHSSILFIVFWAVFILIISWIFTVSRTLLKYGMFKLEKRNSDIHISRGVIEKRQLTLSANRITSVRLVQNIIRQPFGYVAVYVESAGGGSKEEDLSTILIPLCKKNEVNSILQEIIPEFVIERTYESLPKESLRRYMIRLFVPFFVVAGFITYFISYGWLSFILPIAAAIHGYWQYLDAGIGNSEQMLLLKSRKLSLSEVIIPRKRIQSMKATQNVLQKLDDLHTINVSILSSIMGKTFTLSHISENQIYNQFSWYTYENKINRGD